MKILFCKVYPTKQDRKNRQKLQVFQQHKQSKWEQSSKSSKFNNMSNRMFFFPCGASSSIVKKIILVKYPKGPDFLGNINHYYQYDGYIKKIKSSGHVRRC